MRLAGKQRFTNLKDGFYTGSNPGSVAHFHEACTAVAKEWPPCLQKQLLKYV
jgi:hypothetical protein